MPETESSVDPLTTQVVFQSGALDADSFLVLSAHAYESVGQLFEIEVQLALDDEVPLDSATVRDVLHAPAALALGASGEAIAPWFGVLRELELVRAMPDRRAVYRAVLVPSLFYLTQTVRSRVFQELSVPDLVKRVLEDAGMRRDTHFELDLSARYPTREYVVQYQESDYDFLARICEHEGIFFYFDHTRGADAVVFGDHQGAFREAEAARVPFEPRSDGRVDHVVLTDARRTWRVVPQHMVLRDSNWRAPQSPLQADAEIHTDGFGVVSLYGDHFRDEADGARLARVRAEERAVAAHLVHAEGFAAPLRAGQTFTLEGHPTFDELNTEYVILSARRSLVAGADGAAAPTELELLPKSVPFRPARVAPKPRIYGLMHARVDGEQDGTPAPIDDQGRYRVVLPFDEVGAPGGRASRWLRRLQTYAGPGYGMHHPLHIGAEVLVAHVDGDPDRPIIVGAAANPATASPVTSDNPTQSMVRTKGSIVVEYEDDAR